MKCCQNKGRKEGEGGFNSGGSLHHTGSVCVSELILCIWLCLDEETTALQLRDEQSSFYVTLELLVHSHSESRKCFLKSKKVLNVKDSASLNAAERLFQIPGSYEFYRVLRKQNF